MDWMDKAMVTSEISLLVQRMDQARGRIYWRSFSERVHIPPLTFLNARKVDDIYENRMGDRVGMYFSTWISFLRETDYAVTPRSLAAWAPGQTYRSGLGGQLVTGAKIVTAPVWKHLVKAKQGQGQGRAAAASAHERDMEAFYRFQKDGACVRACGGRDKGEAVALASLCACGRRVCARVGWGTLRQTDGTDDAREHRRHPHSPTHSPIYEP